MQISDSWFKKVGDDYLRPWLRVEDPARVSLFDRSALFLLVVTCIWYSVAYLWSDAMPDHSANGPSGWWAWWDQSHYYETTAALAHGELKPSIYWFGYPVLGVPFYWVMPLHPYFVPNLILVLVMVGSFFGSCRFFMGRLEAWVLTGIFIFANPVMRDSCLVIPWNTMPAYAAIYLSAYLLLFHRATLVHYAVCAFLIGMAVFARPTEVIPLSALYLLALLNLTGWRQWLWALTFLGLSGAGVALITSRLNFHFYGQMSSPYVIKEGVKFSTDHYGLKIYQLLCDGTLLTGHAADRPDLPVGGPSAQILERFPVFLLLVPGMLYLVKTRGVGTWGLPLAIVSTVAFNLTYNPVNNPPYFWLYGSYHYIWWIIPWLGFITYLSFRHAPFVFSRGVYLGALLVPVLVFLLIGFKPVVVASSDASRDELQTTTDYAGRNYTVTFVSPVDTRLMGLHLEFQVPPSYQGTMVASDPKVSITVNGIPKRSMVDYMMSQDGQAFDFAFLMRDLRLKAGDRVTVVFGETEEPKLTRVSLRDVVFRWGHPVW